MLKRTLTLAALTALLALPAVAQQGPPPGGGMRRMGVPSIEELTTRLNLTADQQPKVKAMIAQYDTDTKGARDVLMKNMQAVQAGTVDRESVRDESTMALTHMRDRAEQLNKEIRGILDADQQKAFDQYLAERAAQMQQRRQGPPPPAR